jgi:rhodanese-related sulfurtransferase
LTLVDVRIKELFDTGYIPGARNISNEPKADSISKLTTLPKDRLIVVYCD